MKRDSHIIESDQNPAVVVGQIPMPPGLKSKVAMLPGAMVLHRLLKNFRYWSDSRRRTVGGVKRAQMSGREAVGYTKSIYQKIDRMVMRYGGWGNKKILEIGPGDSLGTGLWCLGAGATSYQAIDRFAVELDRDFEDKVFAAIKAEMLPADRDRCREVVEVVMGTDLDVSNFLYKNDLPIEMAPAVLGRSRYDVIFSNAVLEHVGNLEGTLRAMWELLVPGGVMFHDVDLRSHQTFENHPLHFLEYPQGLWRWMSSHNGEPNRVRMPGYLQILDGLGFENIDTGISHVFDNDLVTKNRGRLALEFRHLSIEELRPAVFWFTCRKSCSKSEPPRV